jgi:hypothetical protein
MRVALKQTDGTWQWSGPEAKNPNTFAEVRIDAEKKGLPFEMAALAREFVLRETTIPDNAHYRYEIYSGDECSSKARDAHRNESPAPASTSKWTPEEETEIARLQETEGLNRKSAIQKMRRAQARQARPNSGHVGAAQTGACKAKAEKPAREKNPKAPAKPKEQSLSAEEKHKARLQEPKVAKALAKAREDNPDRKSCKHGHRLTDNNIDISDLLRLGALNCRQCIQAARERWVKKNG